MQQPCEESEQERRGDDQRVRRVGGREGRKRETGRSEGVRVEGNGNTARRGWVRKVRLRV
jgi:hypothetical protein